MMENNDPCHVIVSLSFVSFGTFGIHDTLEVTILYIVVVSIEMIIQTLPCHRHVGMALSFYA
jgi:hypothetical protein